MTYQIASRDTASRDITRSYGAQECLRVEELLAGELHVPPHTLLGLAGVQMAHFRFTALEALFACIISQSKT